MSAMSSVFFFHDFFNEYLDIMLKTNGHLSGDRWSKKVIK
jgi:hypothetical protein